MTEQKPASQLIRVRLAGIADNPWQPRTALDPQQVADLAESFKQIGLLQRPILRYAGDGRFEVAFGHYRIAALKHLGLEDYEFEVRTLSDAEMAIIALTENQARKDISPIEQYKAWAKALEIDGLTVQDLAGKLGLDRSTVSNNLRLLRLPGVILKHVESGELSAHGAREFLCLMGDEDGGPTHFHQDIAEQVLGKLTNGAPDWRVSRVRYLLNEAIVGSRANAWRRLFKGTSPGGGHQAAPLFDLAKFKQDYPNRLHTIPGDDWQGWPGNGKVTKEKTREWTCACSQWVARQQAVGKQAAAVAAAGAQAAGAAATPTAKTSSFKTQLSRDPVFVAVSAETEGTLLKALSKDGELGEEIAERLGSRAVPVLIQEGKSFKALVDKNRVDTYGYGATELPSYFPNVDECLKTCIFGATYGRTSETGPLALWCLNQEHFDQKVADGRKAVTAKMGRRLMDADKRNDRVLGLMAERGLPGLTQMMAAALLTSSRFERLEPDGVDYRERDDLSEWPGNVRRIYELLGGDPRIWAERTLLPKVAELSEEHAQELVMRLLTERAQADDLAQFVPATALSREGDTR